jgi:hypothetical protein
LSYSIIEAFVRGHLFVLKREGFWAWDRLAFVLLEGMSFV